jgi:hypothetical protein
MEEEIYMNQQNRLDMQDYLIEQLKLAKVNFERALDCKHTEFDTLYPYMAEHPQFFWYKRYVAWSELLTIVKISSELKVDWTELFTPKQVDYIVGRVLHGHVLDFWFENGEQEEQAVSNQFEE